MISGDRKCDTLALEKLTGYKGKLLRPDADFVKSKTGYSIGGVSPLGLPNDAEIYIDKYLNRYNIACRKKINLSSKISGYFSII